MTEGKEIFDLNPELVDEPERKSNELPMADIIYHSGLTPEQVNPLIYEVFTDRNFIEAIPNDIKGNTQLLGLYFRNTCLFADLRKNKISIFGEEIVHESLPMANGVLRPKEGGKEIHLEALREAGIDPESVFYYRRTQPSELGTAKPEYYWTSDYWEVIRGLTKEISGQERQTSKILCTSLAELGSDSKLTLDINDDEGIPVRRVSIDPYDQSRVLFAINP
ncbi:MAG: hypothetical protein V4519_05360 [Patescibacteria group bacterium]